MKKSEIGSLASVNQGKSNLKFNLAHTTVFPMPTHGASIQTTHRKASSGRSNAEHVWSVLPVENSFLMLVTVRLRPIADAK